MERRCLITPDWWQSKMLLTIVQRRAKITRNSVFDCHLLPIGRQIAIENSVSYDFIAFASKRKGFWTTYENMQQS